MRLIITALLALAAFGYHPAAAQECEHNNQYSDCSRNNERYRHRRWRSQNEPYYQLHHRAQSKREGFHERADSNRRHRDDEQN